MSIETELRRTVELRNSLNNVRLEKADLLRQKQTIGDIRKQSAELRNLTKEFNKYAKKGGQVADALEKGKWTKTAGNAALGARVTAIINCASLVASFAGLGLSIGNTWLSQVRNQVNENRFDLYGRELGNQLKLTLKQKARIDRIERIQQRSEADIDILNGYVGEQTIKVNRLETGQTFLGGQFAALQQGFTTATGAFNGALRSTRTELLNKIEALEIELKNPTPTFNLNLALNKAGAALDLALSNAKKQTEQDFRIKKLERERTQGIQNQLRIAQARATQALNTANSVKRTFENRIQDALKIAKAEVEREQKLRIERGKFVDKLLEGKQDKSKILDLISSNVGRFYDTYLKPPLELQIKPTEIKADFAVNAVSTQQREINDIKRQLTTVERGLSSDLSRLRQEVKDGAMTPAQDKKLNEILLTVGVIGGLAPAIQQNVSRLRQEMPNLTAQGVCRTMQPGGCSAGALNNLGNSINANTNRLPNLLDKLNAAGNAAQLAILTRIDTKLGTQLAGGLSGGLKRIFDNAIVDRAINTYALILTFHNAAMLSNSLFESILSAGDLILQALGFKVKDAEGNQIDLSQAVRSLWQGFLTNMFGAETVRQINENWARWNRIYQSAANLLSLTQSMFDSVRNVLEVSAQYTGKIGNALKASGTVFDDAYDWMSERVSAARGRLAAFQRFADGLESAENITSNIASVAGSVVSIQQEANEFKQEQTNFNNLLNNQKDEKTAQESQNTQASQSPSISIVQERNPSS